MAFYANSSQIGTNLGNSDGATALFGLNSVTLGSQGSEWIYVCAGSALATGTAVTINSSGTASLLNGSNVSTLGTTIAFAQGTFAASDFGWVARRGNGIYVLVSSVSTVDARLYNSDTSGTLTTTSATCTLAGISLITAAATATAVPQTSYVSWPRLVTGPSNP